MDKTSDGPEICQIAFTILSH